MHIFRRGFLSCKQQRALSGLSGGGFPPLRAGLLVADLAVVPRAWPVCDCAVAGCPSWADRGFWCCPRMGGVAAVGWAPGSPGGPNPEPPSPPALIGRSSAPKSPPSFRGQTLFFFSYPFATASACLLRRLLLRLRLLLHCLTQTPSRHTPLDSAWSARRRPSRRPTTPIDALSQRRPTTRCSSPACYGTGLFRTSLRDLNTKFTTSLIAFPVRQPR